MPDYVVEGKKGAGKSLVMISRFHDYLKKGSIVATNLNVRLENLTSWHDNESIVIRVPDHPSIEHLEALPLGNPKIEINADGEPVPMDGFTEDENSCLCFDECATWFNSRNWQQAGRKEVVDWLVHARKYGWDCYYLIQSHTALDSQAREMLMEHLVTCYRLDRMNVPVIGTAYKMLTGKRMQMPKVHLGKVFYIDTKDLIVDRWRAELDRYKDAYQTTQVFSPRYLAADHESGVAGPFCYVRPFQRRPKSVIKRDKEFYMRLSKLYFQKLRGGLYALSGAAVASIAALIFMPSHDSPGGQPVTISSFSSSSSSETWKEVNYSITSAYHITKVNVLGQVQNRHPDYTVTDGDYRYQIADLKKAGYKHDRVSDCYHVLEKFPKRIIATCPDPALQADTSSL
jgi:hypothetical protein